MSFKNKKKAQKGQDDLSAGELRFIEELCGKPVFRHWVDAYDITKDKYSKRLLVVSRFRVYLIKRSAVGGKKTVTRNVHLYSIVRVACTRVEEVVLEYKVATKGIFNKSKANSSSAADITAAAPAGEQEVKMISIMTPYFKEVILAIRSAYQGISPGFLPFAKLEVDVMERRWLMSLNTDEIEPGGGILTVFRAVCDFYQKRTDDNVVRFLKFLILTDNKEIELSSCPGIEDHGSSALDLKMLCTSLRFNTFFRGLVVEHYGRAKILNYLAGVLRSNYYLTKLVVRSLDRGNSEEGWIQVAQAIRDNPGNAIQVIDFSGNKIGQKAILALADAFTNWSHGLLHVNLENCGIKESGMGALLYAFAVNNGSSATLEGLLLNENTIGNLGSERFAEWVFDMEGKAALKRLEIRNCHANLEVIHRSLMHLPNLTELNISGNTLTPAAVDLLLGVLDKTASLRDLYLSDCSLTGQALIDIVQRHVHNKRIKDIKLILSGNGLQDEDGLNLYKVLRRATTLHTLDISRNKFKAAGLNEVLAGLCETGTLRVLIANDAFKDAGPSTEKVAGTLATVLAINQGLEKLELRGGWKKVIPHLCQPLMSNTSVKYIDFSNNGLGDAGASVLAECLMQNQGIKEVYFDKNGVSLNGFLALRWAFTTNYCLTKFGFPWEDYQAARSLLGSSASQERILDVLESINTACNRNKFLLQQRTPEELKDLTSPVLLAQALPALRFRDRSPPPPEDILPKMQLINLAQKKSTEDAPASQPKVTKKAAEEGDEDAARAALFAMPTRDKEQTTESAGIAAGAEAVPAEGAGTTISEAKKSVSFQEETGAMPPPLPSREPPVASNGVQGEPEYERVGPASSGSTLSKKSSGEDIYDEVMKKHDGDEGVYENIGRNKTDTSESVRDSQHTDISADDIDIHAGDAEVNSPAAYGANQVQDIIASKDPVKIAEWLRTGGQAFPRESTGSAGFSYEDMFDDGDGDDNNADHGD
eukprot:Clim_evm84s134 gene=Clim_evmTU84s134